MRKKETKYRYVPLSICLLSLFLYLRIPILYFHWAFIFNNHVFFNFALLVLLFPCPVHRIAPYLTPPNLYLVFSACRGHEHEEELHLLRYHQPQLRPQAGSGGHCVSALIFYMFWSPWHPWLSS